VSPLQQAAQAALDAWENHGPFYTGHLTEYRLAKTNLLKALAALDQEPVDPMIHKPTADGAATVSPAIKWIKIDESTPRGTKLMLISRRYGVAQFGMHNPAEKFFTHWHPLPTFESK
jgi:hypothetical protein